jgi:hypothetical protein
MGNICRNTPSAIGDRQMLPMQTNSTRVFIAIDTGSLFAMLDLPRWYG